MEQDEGLKHQEIWSWGAGTDGQLATGKLQDEHSPQPVHSLSAVGPISSLSCGGAHVIALTPNGRVLTWGRGTSGQLGHGEIANCLQPSFVKALEGVAVANISAGWNHSGFVSDNGIIFTCGDGSFGQLGHGDYNSKCSPLQISFFSSNHVEQVACGMRHTLVLLRGNMEDKVYAIGFGKRGQLGISSNRVKLINLPQITLGLTNVQISKIGANGDHSAALSADGSLYTWGRGFNNSPDVCIPRCTDAALSFSHMGLGWNHALVLTREGKLYMLGGNRHGVLNVSQETTLINHGKSEEPNLVRLLHLDKTKVLQVAVGAEHSVLVVDNGFVMCWGWGEHGQLGFGDTTDRTFPQAVNIGCKLAEKNSTSVYCGSGFSFVLRTFDV